MGFSLLRSLFLCSVLAACTVQAAADKTPWFENAANIEVIEKVTDFRDLLEDPGVWMVHFSDGTVVDKELETNYAALGTVMRASFTSVSST
jgi:hypothetical protein